MNAQDYLQEGFMFKKPYDNSKAFERYVRAREQLSGGEIKLAFPTSNFHRAAGITSVVVQSRNNIEIAVRTKNSSIKRLIQDRLK